MTVKYPHIFLNDSCERFPYTRPKTGYNNKDKCPSRDRLAHSTKLQHQWAAIWAKSQEERSAVSMSDKNGVYIQFEGVPGYDLPTKELEHYSAGIRLLNVQIHPEKKDSVKKVTRATVYIPSGKHDVFLRKIKDYAQRQTKKGVPSHDKLMRSIEDIKIAVLNAFWCDEHDLLPEGAQAVWCEVWLRGTGTEMIDRFHQTANTLGLTVQNRTLSFPERTVLLVRASRPNAVKLRIATWVNSVIGCTYRHTIGSVASVGSFPDPYA